MTPPLIAEVWLLLELGAIECVYEEFHGFTQNIYFLILRKDVKLRPIFSPKILNPLGFTDTCDYMCSAKNETPLRQLGNVWCPSHKEHAFAFNVGQRQRC